MAPLRSVALLVVALFASLALFPAPSSAIGDGGIQGEGGGLAEAVNCVIGLHHEHLLSTFREYSFEGSCTVGGYGARPFKAAGTYQPPTGEVWEEISLEHPQIGKVWMRSQARFANDPWLYPESAGAATDLQVTFSDQYFFENIFFGASFHSFDSCRWIAEGTREALRNSAATAPPPGCPSAPQTQPAIARPHANEEFPAGTRRFPVSLSFPCRFPSAVYDSRMAAFQSELQVTVKDYGQDELMTLPIDDSNVILMHPSATDPYDLTSYAAAEIPVDYDGKYNIRFRAQWTGNEGIQFGPWSDWVPFWIGPKFSLLTVDAQEILDATGSPALDLAISGVARKLFPAGSAGPDGKLLDADTWFYRWTVRNLGVHEASAPTDLRIECSREGGEEPCPPDKVVGTFPVPAIPPGGSLDVWTSGIVVPDNAADWQLRGMIDAGDQAAEGDESNNERTLSEGFIRPPARIAKVAPPATGGSSLRRTPGKPSVASPTATATPGAAKLKILPAAAPPAPARPAPVITHGPAPATVAAAPPHVAVSRVYASPERPRAGAAFDVLVELKNTGGTPSVKGQQYGVDCLAAPSGASCPLKEEIRTVGRSIAPGAVLPVRLPVASAQAGSYRIKFSPRGGAAADARTLELTVIPAIIAPAGARKPFKK